MQKQPSCKKKCGPQEGHCETDVKSKMVAKNGCDSRQIAIILIMTIQVNLVLNHSETYTDSPELSLLKILPSQLFLAATLYFISFFTIAFFGGRTLFYSLAVLVFLD